ncbi:MAG: hypothetical protein Q7W38_02185 [Deltaproteobacteria bacterium]|nr:hypothetical protein [Deltaproteobacteria bacterium]
MKWFTPRTIDNHRRMLATNANLGRRLNELEKKYDVQFKVLFDASRRLMAEPEILRKKVGFQVKEKLSPYLARNWKRV